MNPDDGIEAFPTSRSLLGCWGVVRVKVGAREELWKLAVHSEALLSPAARLSN